MKLRYLVMSVILSVVVLLQAPSALRAQDVAAAARANRANHDAQAQASVDALRTCVTDNTSGKDRKDLAKWVFFAMAAHPEIKPYVGANVAGPADESSKTMASLVTRLLTESCANEVKAVMKTPQGSEAVKLAFTTLGQLAMQELMADDAVKGSMGAFEQYVDQARLNAVLAGK
jgi:hypothetical protein